MHQRNHNCLNEATDYEAELAALAEEYRAEGYDVYPHPSGEQLPPFAAGFAVDLLVTKGKEKVLVQVKESRQELEKDAGTARLAELTAGQAGWRFDLVVLNRVGSE